MTSNLHEIRAEIEIEPGQTFDGPIQGAALEVLDAATRVAARRETALQSRIDSAVLRVRGIVDRLALGATPEQITSDILEALGTD